MIFPRSEGEWKTLDEHYWARKRLVIGGVLLVESATMAWQLTRAVPALDDYWFWFYQLPYFIPMAALLFTRSRRVDIALFAILIGVQLFSDFDLGPSSRWGHEVGISLIDQSSTSGPPLLDKVAMSDSPTPGSAEEPGLGLDLPEAAAPLRPRRTACSPANTGRRPLPS